MSSVDDLIAAASSGALDSVKAILEAGTGLVNQKDRTGATALHHAALNGHKDIVRLLIERGADPNSRDGEYGATPAGWAIEYLRELGGYLSIELSDFAFAIENGGVRWVKRFLQRFPALRKAVDGTGKSFRQLARESGNPEIERMFEET